MTEIERLRKLRDQYRTAADALDKAIEALEALGDARPPATAPSETAPVVQPVIVHPAPAPSVVPLPWAQPPWEPPGTVPDAAPITIWMHERTSDEPRPAW